VQRDQIQKDIEASIKERERHRKPRESDVLPIVRISESMRKLIESVLDPRDFHTESSGSGGGGGGGSKSKKGIGGGDEDGDGDDDETEALVFAVTKLGFRRPHVLEAVLHASTKDEVLDWLVLYGASRSTVVFSFGFHQIPPHPHRSEQSKRTNPKS
jgi:hypothetical protein